MKNLIEYLQYRDVITLSCCCGHGKYPMTIVVRSFVDGKPLEIMSKTNIPRAKNFYKKDKKGYYYIPEIKK